MPRAVAVMAKDYPAGASTQAHFHPRGQLLHAVDGVMLAKTAQGAWIVPPRHALWIPPHTVHCVDFRVPVSLRTAYIRLEEAAAIPAHCKVIAVPVLLREAILALLEEPVLYDEAGRGGALATLVIHEVARAAKAEFELPLPTDRRLAALCEALIDNCALPLDIDDWATRFGLSRRTLTRRFRAETGLSFAEWRRRLRAMSAAALLSEGAKAESTAHRVGYRSASALIAMMRRR
ncbi:transcriptional regulator, AraC family [Rhodomicrobium vannielii ATCC 17100]|uniref:Transcriptional regulator, AraC family n=2 Tax=Rhodomicrobium vannielii TaxID=1069 RepID=E3I7G9_RHOVT|nr:transcriptional regulator, AraC family [Rhodomicrobium vannielii ATCC 17100]